MANKPTYEELRRKVKQLENECLKYKQVIKGLRESEKLYSGIVEASLEGI